MTVIKLKKKFVLPLHLLMRVVLRIVYEPGKVTTDEHDQMEKSIEDWNNKVNLSGQEKYYLQKMCWMLQKDSEGYFNERKELFKIHDINWRKFHRLVEAGPYAW